MAEMKTVPAILDVIKSITLNGESGHLDISSFGTHGTLLFNEGKLVDARLESLSGFQAVNAAVSLRNVEFSFDHVAPVAQASTITPAERVVLQRFFGIETAEIEVAGDEAEPNWNAAPEQVVPLTVVEQIPHAEVQPTLLTDHELLTDHDLPDTPTVEMEPVRAQPSVSAGPFAFLLRPPVLVAVCVMLLVALAVAATALRSKWKARQEAVVASAVQSEPSAGPDSRQETKQVAEPSPISQSQNRSTKQDTPPRNASPAPAAITAERRETSDEHEDANVQNLTGEWRVINTVDKTAYKSFGSMQVGFRLKINQRGKEFTARGEKFSENGQMLTAASRTPIHVKGSIEGDKVVATFVEEGRMRTTNGRFVWKLQRGGALAGTFISTAANSSGRSAVTKQ